MRTAEEYAAGHLQGAIHLPFYATWSRSGTLPGTKSDELVVYCERGPRARLARFGLESAGFERVRLLEGHMAGWRSAGRPLVKPEP